jgi:hypothetical protein
MDMCRGVASYSPNLELNEGERSYLSPGRVTSDE